MIHEIFVQLRTALAARGVPYPCEYGPPPVPPKVGGTRVYVMRDYEAGDQVLPPRSQMVNPRQYAVRATGVAVRIYAHSTIEGAQRHDHERIADKLADHIHVALHKIIRGQKTLWRVQRAGLVADATTDGWAGVVYELRLQIDRGVHDRTWTDEAEPEGTFAVGATALDPTGPEITTSLPNATTRVS